MKFYLFLIFPILFTSILSAQNLITFKVKEESGEPLIGANLIIKGTTTGTITKDDGIAIFTDLPDSKIEFVISFIGYEEQKIVLVFPGDSGKTIEIELEEGEELEEVVVAATRSSRLIEDIPTRVEAITGEELGEKAAMNSSNIGMLLRETTGVQMQQTSLSSGNMNIRIQGLDGRYTQILKDGFPLYGGFAGGLSIMQIPPLDLKQVELIKGSNSTLYGGGAIAGLVNLVSISPEEKPELSFMLNQTSAWVQPETSFMLKNMVKPDYLFMVRLTIRLPTIPMTTDSPICPNQKPLILIQNFTTTSIQIPKSILD